MVVLTAVGCSVTRSHVFDEAHARLPLPRVADSFTLDVFFARIPCDQQLDDQLWAEIDEQAMHEELRRRLMIDGIRCGLIETQVPKTLESILFMDEHRGTDNFRQAAIDGNISAFGMPGGMPMVPEQDCRIYLRAGRDAEVVTCKVRPKITVLRRGEDGVSGTTYADAQTTFRLLAVDAGDGRARISLSPQVQHGAPKTRFTGLDGSLSLAATRECDVLDELTIQAVMVAGQTLIVTSTPDALTVGANFFQCVDDARQQRKVLLIRLVRAGNDHLYDDSEHKMTIDDL